MKQEKVNKIIKILDKEYGDVDIALNFSNVFELMVATILSAQCTDKRVNIVTSTLFKKYKTIKDYANADLKEFENDIKSTGFYRNKAKNIIETANVVLNKFNGVVPKTMEELTTLKGVARKTANIVLGSGYGINVGIAVDTHVIRLTNLIGLSKNSDPKKIEKDLMKIIPKKHWKNISFMIQTLGRRVCIARRPKCDICPVNKLCNYYNKKVKN
ncbi:endonuclease III [Candidatus Ruminimicrobiellum ovillum]|uniref:endonuclease III n=1 Tax=Candidatus Ruminimicrobiellum ovillum TaxID=1947927 RepID=UPI00355A762C